MAIEKHEIIVPKRIKYFGVKLAKEKDGTVKATK